MGHLVTESARSGQVPVVLASRPRAYDPLTVRFANAPEGNPARDLHANAPEGELHSNTFSRIFSEQFRYVYNTLRRLGVRSADLEDLTHDVFLAVYRHLAEWDPSRPLRPWLFAFAYRTASAYRRQTRRRREITESDHEAQSPERDSLERLVEARQLALVQAALLAVDLEHRAVFILHELDEVPMPETAQALGIRLNTGYSRLRAARRKFDAAVLRLQQRGGR